MNYLDKYIDEATEISKELNSEYVDTSHFTLALIRNKKTPLEITNDEFLEYYIKMIGIPSKKNSKKGFVPFLTPRLITLMKMSVSENEFIWHILNEDCLASKMIEEILNSKELHGFDIFKENFDYYVDECNFKHPKEIVLPENFIDLTAIKYKCNPAVCRDEIIEEIFNNLLKYNKPNTILVGKAGCGKTAIVESMAYKLQKGDVIDSLKNIKIIQINVGNLVAGTKYRGDFEERISKIAQFFKDHPNYVLFIDEIHNTVNVGGAEGAINFAELFKPYLARGDVKMIGATTNEEIKVINSNAAYKRRFSIIPIVELDATDSLEVLRKSIDKYSQHYLIDIDDNVIKEIVNKSYKLKGTYPDVCFDLLEQSFIETIKIQSKRVTKKQVASALEYLEGKTKRLEEILN